MTVHSAPLSLPHDAAGICVVVSHVKDCYILVNECEHILLKVVVKIQMESANCKNFPANQK